MIITSVNKEQFVADNEDKDAVNKKICHMLITKKAK